MSSLAARVRKSARWRLERAKVSKVARSVSDAHLTYLTLPELGDLERCAGQAPAGDFIECGLALGGSGILLASKLGDERAFHGYDVFGMIPPPGPEDPPEVHERYRVIESGQSRGLGGALYYGYRDDLEAEVAASFAAHGFPVGDRVHLHRGLFEDTLHPVRPVALVHIDCDWYDPVKLCLERIWPQLSAGGFFVMDDYYVYEGARKATDEFVDEHPELRRVDWADPGHLILQRR